MIRILVVGILFLPYFVHAQVLFSEIAWMGTDVSTDDEWIEIYNFSNTPTDLTGWTLISSDGKISIALSGTLSPYGVAVLERTDDQTLPNVIALLTYTGALVNSGTTLTLKDSSGATSDEAIGGTDWSGIGGSNVAGSPKMTPQRTRTGAWVTGTPTPGAENIQSGEAIPEGTTDADDDSDTETTVTTKSKSSGGSSSKKVPVVEKLPGVLSVSVGAPKTVYVNQTVDFEAVAKGVGPTTVSSLKYSWNFGDTYTDSGRKLSHTFKYPGEYVVVVGAEFAKQSAVARHEITVLPASFALTYDAQGHMTIKNKATHEVDLGGFTLKGEKEFVFPKFTILKPNGTLTVGEERVGKRSPIVTLEDTKHISVASIGNIPTPAVQKGALPMLVRKEPLADQSTITRIDDTVPPSNVVVPVSPPAPQIIQIGTKEPEKVASEQGMFGRLWDRVASIFK